MVCVRSQIFHPEGIYLGWVRKPVCGQNLSCSTNSFPPSLQIPKGEAGLRPAEPKKKDTTYIVSFFEMPDQSGYLQPKRSGLLSGGAFAPYKRFRRRRKPWRRANSFRPSILNQRVEPPSGRRNPKRKTSAKQMSFFLVRLTGVEPVRPSGHKHLKLASLPIPAQPHRAVSPPAGGSS